MSEKSNPAKDTENIAETKKSQIPPLRYYLVLSFLISLFTVIQDGIYRSDAFLTRLPTLQLIQNGIFVFVFIFFAFMMLSIALWGIDALVWLMFKNKKTSSKGNPYTNFVSGLVYYIVFMYINIVYFRLYLSSFVQGMRKNGQLIGAVLVASIAIVIVTVLYLVKFRKYLQNQVFKGMVNPLFKPVVVLTVIIFISAVILFGLSGKKSSSSSQNIKNSTKQNPHIVLITLDNLRTASMSLYGYKRKTTPFLESFAKNSIVFDNMMAIGTETMTTMPSIVSGKNVQKSFPYKNQYYEKCLPKVLRENGYEKACFLSPLSMNLFPRKIFSEYLILNNSKGNPMVKYSYLGKSRNTLVWLSHFLSEDTRFFNIFDCRDPRDIDYRQTQTIMTEGYDYIIKTLKESKKPVFVWAHYLETHPPYNPPPVLKDYFKGSPDPEVDKYDGCIRFSDYELSNFIGRLKGEGLYDNTLIVISADHGYYFPAEVKTREYMVKGDGPPEACLRFTNLPLNVPLIIHDPNHRTGKRLKTLATHSDIAPTILELAGLEIPPEMDGESLVPYMEDENLTSKKIKVSVPAQYIYRWNNLAFEDMLQNNFEFFNAFYDKYAIELIQKQQRREGKERKIVYLDNLPYTLIGVYDLNKDKFRNNNLKDKPEIKEMTKKVMESKWVKYYSDIKKK